MRTNWEDSNGRYNKLFESLNVLLTKTQKALSEYEQINMDFAEKIYNEELMPIMQKADCLDEYEKEFKSMHTLMSSQIEQLLKTRDEIKMMMIKDSVNFPLN